MTTPRPLLSFTVFLTVCMFMFTFIHTTEAQYRKCPNTQAFLIGSFDFSPFRPEFSGNGITILRQFNTSLTPQLNLPVSITNQNPTYIALPRKRSHIYTCNSAIPAGTLTKLTLSRTSPFIFPAKRAPIMDDARASHISVSRYGVVFISNTFGGSIQSFDARSLRLLDTFQVPETLATGEAGNIRRQQKPGPHMVYLMDQDRSVVVPDLGADLVFIFRYNRDRRSPYFGKLKEVRRIKLDAGDGPRHVVQHEASKNLFVINELSLSVTTLCANDRFSPCQKFNLLEQGVVENGTSAAIRITRNQKFLYASTRTDSRLTPLHGVITGFQIDRRTGRISKKLAEWSSGGAHPRDFNIVYDVNVNGQCRDYIAVANRDSNNLIFFRLDQNTGMLGEADFNVSIGTPSSVLQL